MALGWMTVLQLVPWTEVIKNAPAVAEGARKLWSTVGSKTPTDAARAPGTQLVPEAADHATPAEVLARLAEAEAAVDQLHTQMQASSELIKALAEQNAELVRRVEINRSRTAWLGGGLLVVGAIAGLNLLVTLTAGG